MPIQAKPTISPFWYTPKSEEGLPNPTRFLLKPLNGIELQDAELYKDASGQWRAPARSVELVLGHGLKDWEGVVNAEGEKVNFNKFNQRESLNSLSSEIVAELFAEILIKSQVSEEQRKN